VVWGEEGRGLGRKGRLDVIALEKQLYDIPHSLSDTLHCFSPILTPYINLD
jgi:hypothetical protein